MIEKVTLDMLTLDFVSIKKQQYIESAGIEYVVGEPHRCAYINSERGRAELLATVPEPYLSAVMTIWGDVPTVTEPSD